MSNTMKVQTLSSSWQTYCLTLVSFFFFFSSAFKFPFWGFCTAGLAAVGAKNRLMSWVKNNRMGIIINVDYFFPNTIKTAFSFE